LGNNGICREGERCGASRYRTGESLSRSSGISAAPSLTVAKRCPSTVGHSSSERVILRVIFQLIILCRKGIGRAIRQCRRTRVANSAERLSPL